MNTQEITPVICPQCQGRYNAPVTPIIDVSQNPALKESFLRGELNLGQCPQCSTKHIVDIPVMYHDSEKQLALALVPGNLNLAHADEQRIIGNLTNRLMNSLPPEARKGYLFTPQTFMSFESLVKKILAADGITEDMLQAQAQKLQILDQLFKCKTEDELKKVVQAHQAELDYQFFEIMTVVAVEAMNDDDQQKGQDLLSFRQMIAGLVPDGQALVAQIDEKVGLSTFNPETLLVDLQNAKDDEEFMALVGAGKPILDYQFFQNMTAKIDEAQASGNAKEATKLKSLRTRILDASAKVEEEARKIVEKAQALLKKLLESSDPQATICENLAQFDDIFLSMLVANIEEAEKKRKEDVLNKLTGLYQLIMNALQEQMPPEMRFLNQIMSQYQSPEGAKALLEQNTDKITPMFIELLTHLAADFSIKRQENMATVIAEIKSMSEAILNQN